MSQSVTTRVAWAALAIGLLAMPGALAAPEAPPRGSRAAAPGLARLPLRFEPNQGQAPAGVRYLARGAGYSLLLTDRGATLAGPPGAARLELELVGAAARPALAGIEKAAGVSHYLLGSDPRGWRRSVPQYAAVEYRDVYPGIDLVCHGADGALEYDFVVGAGADPAAIRWRVRGARSLRLDGDGNLLAQMPDGGVVEQRAPRLHQRDGGGRRAVAGRFALAGELVWFEVGDYDRDRPLVIDPVLSYSSYLGGGAGEAAYAVAVGADGSTYLAGYTSSVDFPAAGPLQAAGGGYDAFVAKLDASGASLVYATYLGGSGGDFARALAVGPTGEPFVAGETSSTNFPVAGALRPAYAGNVDAFVARLAADGASLVYSTYLGGSGQDVARGLALDAAGRAHVVGHTYSSNFPIAGAWRPVHGGGQDGFVSQLAADGASLGFSTFVGGAGDDWAGAVAVDAAGSVHVAGMTSSGNFPLVNPRQAARGAFSDAFVLKLTSAGAPVFSTYHGGNDGDEGNGVAADAAGATYVTGSTSSTNFPTASPLQAARAGARDVFVSKFSPDGGTLVFSTYLGGSGNDEGRAIAVDGVGRVHLAGTTGSTNFPTLDAVQPSYGSFGDGFAARLRADGRALVYSTYFGGGGADYAYAAALGADGTLHVAGVTESANLPIAGALQPTRRGSSDAFVARLADPNLAPVAQAGADQTVELPLAASLDGGGSSDANGDPLGYEWRDGSGAVVGNAARVALALPAGSHRFTLTVSDGRGGSSEDSVLVTVVAEAPPAVSLSAPRDATVYAGVPVQVEWSASDDGGLLRFDVSASSDGGASYAPVAGCTGVGGAARSCTWAAPGPASAQTRLRIVATDAAGHSAADVAALAIVDGVIAVTSQNDPAAWPLGSMQSVTWTHNLPAGAGVDVAVSVNGGATWTTVAAGVPNTGRVDWLVRPPHSGNGRVRVCWTANAGVADVNDAAITIGTPAVRVKNVNPDPGGSASPSLLTNVDGTLFFVAYGGVATGKELWRSDGSEAGTVLVKDITPGPAGTDIRAAVAAGGRLYFTVGANQLWRSDGTAAGTVRMENGELTGIWNLTAMGDATYFSACSFWEGCELWRASSDYWWTSLVKDISAGSASSSPERLTAVGGALFFTATQPGVGTELWRSDGTSQGTALVRDIYPGADLSSYPSNLTAVGSSLYFTALSPSFGRELWRSDGTAEGTAMVANLAISYTSFYIQESAAVGSRLFFRGFFENGGPTWNDEELWKSDGTVAGSGLVKDIAPGEIAHSQPRELTDVGGVVYFSATEPRYGWSLWRSDGTAAGTVSLKSFLPEVPSAPLNLRAAGGALFFNGSHPVYGIELWRTDGTAEGTYVVQDLAAGAAWGNPGQIRSSGHRIFFAARDAGGDVELWMMPQPINERPSVSAGADRAVELGAAVTLTAAGRDADGDALTYEWRDAAGTVLGATASIGLTLPPGVHTLTVAVADGFGAQASDSVVVTVRDTTASLEGGGRRRDAARDLTP